MRKLLFGIAFGLVACLPLSAQDDPAALVVRVQGDVQVRRGSAEPAAAMVGERLDVGDQVVPAPGGRAILVLRTGATQIVTESTTVSAPSGGGNPDMFARAVRTLAHAATTDASAIVGRQGMIRPLPGEPVLVAPRNDLVVSSLRPAFTWLPVDGATGYTLQVRVVGGGRPERFQVGHATVWSLPEEHPDLIRGETYAWTVAPTGGRPTREQQFRVIGPDVQEQLSESLTALADLGMPPESDGLFFAVMVYRDLELFYDAATGISAMEAAEMSLSAEMYLLKGEIFTELGQGDEARKAFDKADEMMR